ncbi:iron ABC transporter permease [Paenibacillus sp.]|uniref:FecCD family ABC transporter permease n=1 Tax=Paenibacillus sp. TaxID=58172 RepID=UPI00281219A8|nr:iron ABC transporter permease [Paenibacillus sp.]
MRPRVRSVLLPILLILVVLASSAAQAALGTPNLTWGELFGIVFRNEGEPLARTIVLEMRLPRAALGVLIGAMLGASGTLVQGAMNNRLAGPELLGVSSGASLAMGAIAVLQLPVSWHAQPLFALLGGMAGGVCVLLAARGSRGAVGMLLIGMTVSAILNGTLILLIALGTSNDVNQLYLYLLGSLANRSWEHVERTLPWFAAMAPMAFLYLRTLNVMQLGDDVAAGLGVNVERSRRAILALCTGFVGVTVAQCGPIGFISLLAPHLARSMLGTNDARLTLPFSMLCGGALLVSADAVARLLLYPAEIPVGVWTTLLGGSCFLILMVRRQGGVANG